MQQIHLFSPLKIRDVQFKNRITMSPMCQYSSIDGFANDWHLAHLGSRAMGGVALIMTEAAAVAPIGRISPQDLGIWSDHHIDYLSRITKFISEHNAIAAIQLAHAGRKASTKRPWEGGGVLTNEEGGWQVVAPSAIPFSDNYPTPKELTLAEIKLIIEQFAEAAKRSIAAGFKVIEIHSAHGYLLHEFFSPLSNKRTDEYGGSFENRVKLLLQVVQAVRISIGESIPLFVRLSCTDWVEGGWTIADTIKLSKLLKSSSVDLIDASSGGNISYAEIPVHRGYQVPFAEQIRHQATILSGAVGLITTPDEANEIILNGKADLVLLGRELLRNPYWPLYAAKKLNQTIDWPVQYGRAAPH